MRRLLVAMALAVAGGAALAISFPPLDYLRPLAVLGPMFLALSLRDLRARTAYLVAFVFGLAFFIPHIAWAGEYLGWLPWFALAAYQAVFVGFLGPALVAIRRLPVWPVLAACAWVGMEALRSRYLFGGFPWGRLGFSQDAGPFTPYVAVGGVPLLSGVVALCGFLLADALVKFLESSGTTSRPIAGAVRRVGVAALIPVLGGLGWFAIPSNSDQPKAAIAVIQGDVPQAGLEFNARRRAVLDNHVKETVKLAEQVEAGEQPRPALVIWPENSSDIDPFRNEDAATAIQAAADAIDAPILVGAVVLGPKEDQVQNMAIMWWPQDSASGKPAGPDQTYVKRHPAPFAEYIPYRSFFRQITSMVDQVRTDFVAGDRVGTFDVPGTGPDGSVLRFGDVICFEVAYDDLVADTVDGGAQFIVIQTNNATFGETGESYQQFAMSRLRAVEHGRTVLSASTSGVSGIILPDGKVIDESGLYEPAAFVREVPIGGGTTLATRLGRLPEWLMCGAAVIGVGWGIGRGRRE